jgi:hypothetical protein
MLFVTHALLWAWLGIVLETYSAVRAELRDRPAAPSILADVGAGAARGARAARRVLARALGAKGALAALDEEEEAAAAAVVGSGAGAHSAATSRGRAALSPAVLAARHGRAIRALHTRVLRALASLEGGEGAAAPASPHSPAPSPAGGAGSSGGSASPRSAALAESDSLAIPSLAARIRLPPEVAARLAALYLSSDDISPYAWRTFALAAVLSEGGRGGEAAAAMAAATAATYGEGGEGGAAALPPADALAVGVAPPPPLSFAAVPPALPLAAILAALPAAPAYARPSLLPPPWTGEGPAPLPPPSAASLHPPMISVGGMMVRAATRMRSGSA